MLSSNISSTCPHNMVNFGPLAAEIVSRRLAVVRRSFSRSKNKVGVPKFNTNSSIAQRPRDDLSGKLLLTAAQLYQTPHFKRLLGDSLYKSSAVAEMGDRGHNRHGPKRGGC